MANRFLDVNAQGLIEYTQKLDKMKRSSLPNAVRNTLNTMAFDTKKKTLLQEAKKSFVQRNPSFFRRFSRVEMAKGFNINLMRSTVGMVDRAFGRSSEQAGRDMTQQQVGGRIGGRTFVPLDTARTSKSHRKNVRRANRLDNLNIVLDTLESRASDPKQRFVQSAIHAVERFGTGAVIKHRRDDGKTFLYKIERGGSDLRTRQFNIKITPLYSIKSGRSVSVRAQPFTFRASVRTAKNVARIYKEKAERELRKLKRVA
jgi:hypothetical protein